MAEKKEKPKSPREILTDKIDQLAPGPALLFHLPEMYGPEIILVEAKKDFTGKEHGFGVVGPPPVDGKPGPTRNTIWETSKAKAITDWLGTWSAELSA